MTADYPFGEDARFWRLLSYHSFYSETDELLYVATPKVACTSLKWWFASLVGADQAIKSCRNSRESEPALKVHDCFSQVAPENTGLRPDKLASLLQSKTVRRFALVRNPYTRVFSAWQSKVMLGEQLQTRPFKGQSFLDATFERREDIAEAFQCFLEFVRDQDRKDPHWATQASLLRPDLFSYDLVGKFEDIAVVENFLKEILKRRAPSINSMGPQNVSLIHLHSDFLTCRSIHLIKEIYAEDFVKFGYSPQPPRTETRVSEERLEIALRSIAMIQARNQRIAEIQDDFSDLLEKQELATSEVEILLDQERNLHAQKLELEKSKVIDLENLIIKERSQFDKESRHYLMIITEMEQNIGALQQEISNIYDRIERIKQELFVVLKDRWWQRTLPLRKFSNRIRKVRGRKLKNWPDMEILNE